MGISQKAELADSIIHGLGRRHPHLTLHMIIDLRRRFGREELVRAVAGLIEDVPVMGCHFAPGWWRDEWIPMAGGAADMVHVEEAGTEVEAATLRLVRMPFHAEAGPVMRVSSLEHGVLSRLIVSVPHMASDGGGLKALANILGARLYGVPPGRPVSNRRGLLQIAGGIRLLQLPTLAAEALREIFRPLGILRVQPLAKGFAPRGGDAQPIWRTVSLTGEPARHFAAFCRKNGSTINDGLVAMLAMLAAGRSERGPVAVGYTIDLRRYLPSPVSVVTNLHATTLAVVERSLLDAPSSAVRAISRRTAVEKRRMFGMAYALLPVIQVGWLPRGWLRWIAWMLVSRLFSYVRRALVFTNIGALDEALAPFGGDAVSASVIGPFVNESPVPVVTVTGFRGDLTMQVCQAGNLALEAVDEYSAELLAALKRLDG